MASLDNKVDFPIGVFTVETKAGHTTLKNCTGR